MAVVGGAKLLRFVDLELISKKGKKEASRL